MKPNLIRLTLDEPDTSRKEEIKRILEFGVNHLRDLGLKFISDDDFCYLVWRIQIAKTAPKTDADIHNLVEQAFFPHIKPRRESSLSTTKCLSNRVKI